MAKKKQDASREPEQPTKPVKKKAAKPRAAGDLPWHPVWRWLASGAILVHLLAVVSAPWGLSTGPALPPGFDALQPPQPLPPMDSPVWQRPIVVQNLHWFFHDYLNLLYLNHGYEFFAPDPAGTHVIDYQVTRAAGEPVTGRLPSHDQHWPRLLYHRHMMLSEQSTMPQLAQKSPQHYADHLATIHNGISRLELKFHNLLPPRRVADDTPLDAPSTFQLIGTIEGRPCPTPSDEPAPITGAQP
ncbi:MAG: hypothetical protein AAGD11_14385 [Planctomycetota bacterium]